MCDLNYNEISWIITWFIFFQISSKDFPNNEILRGFFDILHDLWEKNFASRYFFCFMKVVVLHEGWFHSLFIHPYFPSNLLYDDLYCPEAKSKKKFLYEIIIWTSLLEILSKILVQSETRAKNSDKKYMQVQKYLIKVSFKLNFLKTSPVTLWSNRLNLLINVFMEISGKIAEFSRFVVWNFPC